MIDDEESSSDKRQGKNDEARPKLYNNKHSGKSTHSFYCSDEMISQKTEKYINDDKGSSMTWTRKLVEEYLLEKSWYFPQNLKDNAPDLTKAYAYYEHFTLARHLNKKDSEDTTMERSEPGELEPTELYSPLFASSSSLSEFGIGIGLYFNMLRILALILMIAGLINLPYILYFASEEYNGQNYTDVLWSTRGSAVCLNETIVACDGCPEKMGKPLDEIDGVKLFAKTNCPSPDLAFGMVNYSTLIFLLICFFLLGIYEKRREIALDEAKQTAQDYSVVVKNPPPDAYDPEVWKAFFSKYTESSNQVTSISIILNNHQLVRKLTKHRVWKESLQRYFSENVDIDDEDVVRANVSSLMNEREGERKNFCSFLCGCTLIPILRCLGYFLPPDILVDNIFDVKTEIKELLGEKYDVIKVFVTFETEAAQRNTLHKLQTSKNAVKKNITESIADTNLFSGRVLYVVEAPEPDTVRWLDLDTDVNARYVQRIITLLLTIAIIAGAGFLVGKVRVTAGSTVSAYLTVVFNFLIPLIVKLLVLIEKHTDESSRQQSLYLKITLFRWCNTAILPMFQTPFNGVITGGDKDLIIVIKNILFADLIFSPLLRLLDIVGNVGKHFFAPRERTQERMNLWFRGTNFNLGERYTDFTKTLFVVFMYSALYPTGFFFGAAILMVQYYVDRYCLMRIWKQPPLLGSDLASFSRSYFYPTALLGFGMASSYIYAQFPFTWLCNPQGGQENIEVNNTIYEKMVFCEQGDWSVSGGGFLGFPAVPSVLERDEWTTKEQETLSIVYGWSTVLLLITMLSIMFGRSILSAIQVYFKVNYKPEGKDAQIDFQNVSNIHAYIPQIFWGGLQYPVLACDVNQVNKDWIGWIDPTDPSFDKHNIIYDFQHKRIKKQIENQERGNLVSIRDSVGSDVEVTSSMTQFNPAFSIVKSWSRAQGNDNSGLTSAVAF